MRGEIHVWKLDLRYEVSNLIRLRSLLSSDELERASRFRFDRDRDEFVVSRGTLRLLLAGYVGEPPGGLQFTYSKYGRPGLAGLSSSKPPDFNVSHSGKTALLAFARERRIGIDVEEIRGDFNPLEISERFFSTAERKSLSDLSAEQRLEGFFRCWTRKEAFIKAIGEGLSHPLHQFDVSLAPDTEPALLATRPHEREARRWKLWDVTVPVGYFAALASEVVVDSP
jgi:4'-phosphopantetheinyl transferase